MLTVVASGRDTGDLPKGLDLPAHLIRTSCCALSKYVDPHGWARSVKIPYAVACCSGSGPDIFAASLDGG